MYHEFDEVRRIHQPYTDNFQRSKSYSPHPVYSIANRVICLP